MEVDLTSVPRRSSTAKHNLGILFDQFNDVNFYVEDEYKENFYLQIFKKLFPSITIDKIFGLGGKTKVIEKARLTTRSKKDIYILDQDFDEILSLKITLNNTFYLDRYCIENYLIEQTAIRNIVKDEKTTIKNEEIDRLFNVEQFTTRISELMIEISPTFLFVRKFSLEVGFFDLITHRDIDFTINPYALKGDAFSKHKLSIKEEFETKFPNLEFNSEYNWCKQYFKDHLLFINTPGKYIMRLIKDKIKLDVGIGKFTSYESFNYRIGNHCSLDSLQFLKNNISKFLS